jgi:hypothetical protein
VDPIPSLAGTTVTGGRINARLAVGAPEPPPDGDSPDDVVDLGSSGVNDDSITLSWTAPADDAGDPASGPAYLYDVRYLDEPLSGANWDAAWKATAEPVPSAPGAVESFSVGGLDGATTYWLGLEAYDDAGNRSGVSNVVSATTSGAPDPWQRETVDDCESCGYSKSLAYDATGKPCLAYTSGTGPRFACWNGASWDIEQVAEAGGGISLAFDPNTLEPTVTYVDGGKLWVARRNGSTWDKEWLERRSVGTHTSLAFDHDGNPAVSYWLNANKDDGLKLARWNGSSWNLEIVDPGVRAYHGTVAFDSDNHPVIGYGDDTDENARTDMVKYARWNGSSWEIEIVEEGYYIGGYYVTLALDPITGYPGIAHVFDPEWTVRLALWNGSSWEFEDVGPARYSTFTFDPLGRPLVAACKNGQALFYHEVDGIWEVEVIDEGTGNDFYYTSVPSIAIAPDGEPGVAYQESWADDLRFAKRSP